MSYLLNKYSIISNLPIFSGLSYFQKKFIASRCQIVEFKKGDIIYEEGGLPDYFYCIINGRVEIYQPKKKSGAGQESILERLRRGEYFGSVSCLTNQPHTVSVRALNDSGVLRINKEDFNLTLKKIPQLAVYLSHSLSSRLSKKDAKEIFESKIISIFGLNTGSGSTDYAEDLAENIKKESGKKVSIIKSGSIANKEEASAKLSLLTGDYHYVLVDAGNKLDDKNFEILEQSDICHILTASDKDSLSESRLLAEKLENCFGKDARQAVSIIIKEDKYYSQSSYEEKMKILSREIFTTLAQDKIKYQKTIKRIAREISGVMLGLALGGGGAIGLAHIGVLKVLEKEDITVDIISATSIGALVASLWASGFSGAEIEKIASGFKGRLRNLFLVDPTLSLRGLIKGHGVKKVLKSYLGEKTFFDLKLPLKIVACDIKNRSEIVIDKGNVVDAIMASIAIPGIFEPVQYEGKQLIDGGIVNPVPVSVLSKLGIKRIIAVNTLPSPADIVRIKNKRLNIFDVIVNSIQAMEYNMAVTSCQQADLYIHPISSLADWYEIYKAKLFIKTGEEKTEELLAQIKELVKK